MNTHDIDIELPPLPAPDSDHYDNGIFAPVWKQGKLEAYARAAIEAYRQHQGEVVVTKTPEGDIIAVTRQDAEGRILSVIAEADNKRRGEPVAVIRYERNTPGRENEMPRVISCNRLPDGDYPVFTAPQPAEPDYKQLFEQMCERCDALDAKLAEYSEREPVGYIMPTALKQLKAGGNAIVGGVSQGWDVAVYLAPQPAENSVNLEVAIQAISALHSNDTDWDTSYWNQAVGRCVSELNKLRSQQPAEPVKVPSDDEIREVFLANGFTIKPGHDDLKPYVYQSARALIARCGSTTDEATKQQREIAESMRRCARLTDHRFKL